jgi:hypothetical protein
MKKMLHDEADFWTNGRLILVVIKIKVTLKQRSQKS